MIPVNAAIISMLTIVSLSLGSMVSAIASHNIEQSFFLPLPEKAILTERTVDNSNEQHQNEYRWKFKNLTSEVGCLAENIYFEARGEEIKGQIAVGLVTINRVKSPRYPNSICDVVWQQSVSITSGKLVAQFSWTLDGIPDIPHDTKAWESSYRLAEAMIAEGELNNFHDFTKGSTHYHANYVSPVWGKTLNHTITIGEHLFYSLAPVAISQ